MDESLGQLRVIVLVFFFYRGKNENEWESKKRSRKPINGWHIFAKNACSGRASMVL